jgi:hypothetical protein
MRELIIEKREKEHAEHEANCMRTSKYPSGLPFPALGFTTLGYYLSVLLYDGIR